jgi:hypothetical protein
MRNPTPADRLSAADITIAELNATLERLWLERHHLYACILDVKTLRRSLELAREGIERGGT